MLYLTNKKAVKLKGIYAFVVNNDPEIAKKIEENSNSLEFITFFKQLSKKFLNIMFKKIYHVNILTKV